MVRQMSATAQDYAKAARAAGRHETKASAPKAWTVVTDRIAAIAKRLAGQPREAAQNLIDACPQPDGSSAAAALISPCAVSACSSPMKL